MKIMTLFCLLFLLSTSCQREDNSPEMQPPILEKNQQEFTDNQEESPKQQVVSLDLSTYFQDLEGTAVFLHSNGDLFFHDEEKSHTPYSPYSTFKIMSTLIGLEEGILTSLDSKMNYNGTIYWNFNWNRDVTLLEAFQTSCVWYFRQVLDELSHANVKYHLNLVNYGNCDISSWEGSGKNPISELNGFWLGSSLSLSPVEQVYVLHEIFSPESHFQKEHISLLKTCMETEIPSIYGKTGAGNGESWFVAFQEIVHEDSGESENLFFAFHLESNGNTSQTAKDVALSFFSENIVVESFS